LKSQYSQLCCYLSLLTVDHKAMYQFYEVLVCLLKFDFFAFTGITIQVGVNVTFCFFILPRRLPVASHRRSLEGFDRVWSNSSCDSCGPGSSYWMWSCRPTRNQIVRILGADVLLFPDMKCFGRLMAFSLFLMLASETYCKLLHHPLSFAVTHLFHSWYVIFVGPVHDPISYVPVYKLVRFYDPDSEAQYETTRATLTVFGGYFMVPGLSMC